MVSLIEMYSTIDTLELKFDEKEKVFPNSE